MPDSQQFKKINKKTGAKTEFGNPAVFAQRPAAFRPGLTAGLALTYGKDIYSRDCSNVFKM
jgi:hypothetical protein